MKKRSSFFAFMVTLVCCISLAGWQNGLAATDSKVKFPTKTVTIIAPYGPGGTVDIMARTIADRLAKDWKQSVIVVNKPGGGGSIGVTETVNATPDGHTLVIAPNSALLINPMVSDLGYTYKNLTPIAIICDMPVTLAVAASSPFKTLADLVTFAKANPQKLRYSTPGANSIGHLMAESFCSQAGIKMTHVPNASSPQAVGEVMGGHIEIAVNNISALQPSHESGQLRILAIGTEKRLEGLPDVPLFKDYGYAVPGTAWFALEGPKGMNQAVVEAISAGVAKVLADPALIGEWKKIGMPATYFSPAKSEELIKNDIQMLTPIFKSLGIDVLAK